MWPPQPCLVSGSPGAASRRGRRCRRARGAPAEQVGAELVAGARLLDPAEAAVEAAHGRHVAHAERDEAEARRDRPSFVVRRAHLGGIPEGAHRRDAAVVVEGHHVDDVDARRWCRRRRVGPASGTRTPPPPPAPGRCAAARWSRPWRSTGRRSRRWPRLPSWRGVPTGSSIHAPSANSADVGVSVTGREGGAVALDGGTDGGGVSTHGADPTPARSRAVGRGDRCARHRFLRQERPAPAATSDGGSGAGPRSQVR